MGDSEIVDKLKKVAQELNSPFLKTRDEGLKVLNEIVIKADLPPQLVKGISRLIVSTIPTYTEGCLKNSLLNVIKSLCRQHPSSLLPLATYINNQAQQHSNVVHSSLPLGRTYLFPLRVCILLWKENGAKIEDKEAGLLVESIAIYFALIVGSNNKTLIYKVTCSVTPIWLNKQEDNVKKFIKALGDGELSIHRIVLGGYMLQFMFDRKVNMPLDTIKATLIEAYVKQVITTKTKPLGFILEQTRPLLKQLSHEDFAKTILPSAQKSLLRNPEVILLGIAYLCAGVNLDLSKYVADISKAITSPIHAKEDQVRDDAIEVCHQLAKQCSDTSALEAFIKQLFEIYFGSDGKLTVAAHKISVLQAIEKVSQHSATGNASYTLSCLVLEKMIKVLEMETHEGSLVTALGALSAWTTSFSNEIPSKLISFFPKGMNLKSSTSVVRSAYVKCLLTCISPSNAGSLSDMIPHLLNSMDKNLAQTPQISQINEMVTTSTLLLRLGSSDVSLENKVEPIWTSALDLKKGLFTGEKFLLQSSEEGLLQLVALSELLVTQFTLKLGNDCQQIYHCIIWCLICPHTKVRNAAQASVRKMTSCLGGIQFAKDLLIVLQQTDLSKKEDKEDGNNNEVTSGTLAQALRVISNVKLPDNNSKENFVIQALPACCNPVLGEENKNLWEQICKSLGLQASSVILNQKDIIIKMITTDFSPTPVNENIVQVICELGGRHIFEELTGFISKSLDNPKLLEITEEDFSIFSTPEGTLYHQELVDNAFEDQINLKNVRKTNKAYSHKEQIMMIEEKRKEMEKKKKEGKLELTPKQKEIMKAQLEKEHQIRLRVSVIHNEVVNAVSLFESAVAGNVDDLAPYLVTLVPLVIKYLPSVIVGAKLAQIFINLRKCVFEENDDVFAFTLARTIVRGYNAAMTLPVDWEGEELDTAAMRTLKMLHKATVPSTNNTFNNKMSLDEDDIPSHYTAPGFVYCYPLLEYVFNHWPCGANEKDKIASLGLQVISEHMNMRGSESGSLFHPKLLPRKQLLNLVIGLISTSEGRTQQTACAVLREVCMCGSGEEGCDKATPEEITILLHTLTAPAESVRDAGLRGLLVVLNSLPKLETDVEGWLRVGHRLWVAKHDASEEVEKLANELWEKANMEADGALTEKVLEDVVHPTSAVRMAASSALASLAKDHLDLVETITLQLISTYKDKLEMTPAKRDQYDRIIEEAIDHWEGRSGVALALTQIALLLDKKTVVTLANFFVPDALGDRNDEVRKHMLDAAMAVINAHGKETVNNLLPVFEKFLNTAPNHASYDSVRQSVIILMGSLAKHLDHSDSKIKPIVAKLVEALSTPSQQVQEAVANCLHPLVPAIKDDCPRLVTKLMTVLLESESYGERKGAAYGLGSLVKGMGILALKQLDIMNQLTNAIQEKKNYRYREGALFALEQLCNMLGKLFEPYIVHVLPHLLLCFGDANQYVREATDDTAKAVMSKLSAHGVKLVLPSLLAALEEDSWRTKTGSVELLGNMAFCAPKQLSSCLPSIVPRLIEVLSDSHQKVQKAGAQALKLIGSVIRNPEIQAIAGVLLDALQDPTKNTSTCLQTLLETKFVHFIDAPSLALIMPVVQRAFQDRSTEVRKMAAQIIGNMYSLTDQKDLSPYLPAIIPGLQASLLDPVPKVRSVSARALGAMVKGMGESSFDDLLPWLMQTLTSEASPVDRSGAAQGLAEVVGGLGPEKLHRLMPDIVATAERSDIAPHVKDGYIMMFIFLPTVFQQEFTPYIGQIIPPILKALADENEFVRDTALRAGQRIVNTYAETAIMLLLPELERGLFHDNWRIRFSSVQLLGDLLYRVSGVSGKMTTDTASEDDNFGTEQSHKAIVDVLGEDRRNRVLAGLYMGRSDVALMVRQAALHVWKVVVTNTPKTLKEILPTLFSLLLGCLASTSHDKRQVAARTLGDLVRKLGERVLPEIIPILEAGLESDEADHRQGVCIGLSEIMESTSKDMILCFAENLVPTVRRALCDPLPAVREAAAHTFDSLHNTVGSRALDDILPHLLKQLGDDDESREYALDGLKQVMSIKSKVVLPYLVPQLTAPPVNTQALCILASVAGESLTRHLSKILPALLTALKETEDSDEYDDTLSHCQGVVLAVVDEGGVTTIIEELLQSSKSTDVSIARGAAALLLSFCSNTRADYSDYVPQLIRGLIHLFTHTDKRILKSAWEALNAVTKSIDLSDQKSFVSDVRQAVKFAASDLKGEELMPGFCLPKGIQPILPIFREAVLNGEPELKESASNGLTEVIRLTSSDALKASVIHVTGPLIRILGDRFAWNVKVAVLDTLALLLAKAGPMLKPFLPQLQTTFVKAIHDPHRGVRLRAGVALAHLITIHTKPDPLFTELHNSIKNADQTTIRDTMIQAMRLVVAPAGDKMSEVVKKGLVSTLTSLLSDDDSSTRLCAAGSLGVLLKWLPDNIRNTTINNHVIDNNPSTDWTIRHGHSAALFSALKSAPTELLSAASQDQISAALLSYISSDRVALVENGAVGIGYLIKNQLSSGETVQPTLITPFSKLMNHTSNEIKQAMCRSCQFIAESFPDKDICPFPQDIAKSLLPMLVNGTKEKNPIVRSAAEMALIAALRLRDGEAASQKMLQQLDGGAKDALNEVINKSLKRASYQRLTEAEVDLTLLT